MNVNPKVAVGAAGGLGALLLVGPVFGLVGTILSIVWAVASFAGVNALYLLAGYGGFTGAKQLGGGKVLSQLEARQEQKQLNS